MDDPTRKGETVNNIGSLLAQIMDTDPSALMRSGSSTNFEEYANEFNRLKRFCVHLNEAGKGDVPFPILNELTERLVALKKTYNQILQFTGEGDSASEKGVLVREFQETYSSLFHLGGTLLSYDYAVVDKDAKERLKAVRDNMANQLSDLDGQLSAIRTRSDQEMNRLEEKQQRVLAKLDKESKSLISHLRDSVSKKEVGRFGNMFSQSSNNHWGMSIAWLLATVVVAVGTVWYFLDMSSSIAEIEGDISSVSILQSLIPRAAVFSVLYYIMVFCSRSFRAHMHNATLNKHRQNALESFDKFLDAAESDQETKNAILLQVAKAIFDPQHTAFTGPKSDTTGPAQILEITRSLKGGPES